MMYIQITKKPNVSIPEDQAGNLVDLYLEIDEEISLNEIISNDKNAKKLFRNIMTEH